MIPKSTDFIKHFKKLYIFIFLTILFPQQFGKNIVQYDKFDWNFIQTQHFDIYYYSGGEINAEIVAFHAENAYDKISNLIGWGLKERTSIIAYNSHIDFQQTNVIDIYMSEGIGGVTELMKNRMVIPYDGDATQFKQVIYHELVHVFINDGMYGGSLQNLSNISPVYIPKWMNEGLAEYLSFTWDVQSDMWIRDLSINYDALPEIQSLHNLLAYRGGQSVWKFITEKWGEESIAEIFYGIKRKKDLNKGIKHAIGVDLKELNTQWHKYLKKEYWPDIAIRDDVQDIARQLTNHEELENSYNIAPSPSPDGSKIAMYSNRDGEMGIYILSLIDGIFLKRIIRSNKTAETEELHILKPGISWSSDNERIVYAAKSGDKDVLFISNINKKKKKIKLNFNMEGIYRPTWNPTNNMIAFVGNNGQASDIYVYNLDDDSLINLTNDLFSDIQVSWHPNGKELLIISDRGNFIETNNRIDLGSYLNHDFENLDIYNLSLDGVLYRLTNTDYNETYASYSTDGSLIGYISDESGINNIYISNDNLETSKGATNVLTGITQISWLSNNQMIFTGFYKSGYDIFILSNINRSLNNVKDIPISKWRQKNKIDLLRKSDLLDEAKNNSLENFVFSPNTINNDKFDNDIKINDKILKDNTGKHKAHVYTTRFTLDQGKASYVYDSIFGSKGMAEFSFSDILGDHRIVFATEFELDFETSYYFLRYDYLKKKINYSGIFYHLAYRTNHVFNLIDFSETYQLNRNLGLNINISYPFSRFSRLDFGLNFDHYIKENKYESSQVDSTISSASDNIFLPSLKYVFDNTRWFYLYPVSGSRVYLKYEVAPSNGVNDFSYHKLTLDSRNYIELSFTGKISLAARIYGGTSWGKNKRQYAIGGIPWIASSDDDTVSKEYETSSLESNDHYYFMNTFAYPIRGYEMATKFGDHAMLMNYELRLPMLMYYFPAIRYFGQIFGVFFVDMGVAWNDDFPGYNNRKSWKKSNEHGWVMSYGFGPRFILFNIPWKLDYAWQYDPYEGKKSNKKWYLSIGLDF